MSNQTNKKSPQDRGDNEEKDINMSFRSIWLDSKTDNRTFFTAEYDPDLNVEEVKELLNKDKETKNVN